MKPARFAACMVASLLLLSAFSPVGETRPPAGDLLLSDVEHLPPGAARRRSFAPRPIPFLPSALNLGEALSPPATLGQEVEFAQTNASERLSQLQQAAAALPGGGFGVVWEVGGFPAPRDVRMQWLDRNGSLVFPPGGLLVAGTPEDEADALIAAHPTSGAYVAFTDGRNVRAQYFDATGTPRWPGTGVVAGFVDSDHYASDPHIVPNPAGGVFVCFEISGTSYDLRCQLIDETGSRRWGDDGSSVGVTPDWAQEWRVLPRGLSDGAGGLLLFWQN